MQRVLVAALLAGLLGLSSPARAGTGIPPSFVGDGDNAPFGYLSDSIEITFNSGAIQRPGYGGRLSQSDLQDFANAYAVQPISVVADVNVYKFRLHPGVDPASKVRALSRVAGIRSVSVIPLGHVASDVLASPDGRAVLPPLEAEWPHLIPNDPQFPQQWNLAQIQDPAAWDIAQSCASIAIIDTGVNTHPDLNQVGAVNFTTDPTLNDQYGTYGHGTPMAGIAGALANNGIGIAGAAGPCGLLDAIRSAWTTGHVVIAATGNENASNFNNICPAASPYAIAVGGTDGGTGQSTVGTDLRWCGPCGDPPYDFHGSNYGNPGVDVSAPSTNIWLTVSTGTYQSWGWAGTSGATAHVSGVVAMMMSRFGYPSPDYIRAWLDGSADKVGGYNYSWSTYCGGQSAELGCGRVNAYGAVR